MSTRRLTVRVESWPIKGSFRIARGAKTEAHVVVAEIADGDTRGRGECVPYARYGETVESVRGTIESAFLDGYNPGALDVGAALEAFSASALATDLRPVYGRKLPPCLRLARRATRSTARS